jgi:hypothetical protein
MLVFKKTTTLPPTFLILFASSFTIVRCWSNKILHDDRNQLWQRRRLFG